MCPEQSFHFISLVQCLTPCTEHAAHLHHLFPLFQVSKGCSHPELPALIHENPEVLDALIENLAQVVCPNRIVDNQTVNGQETVQATEDSQITEIEDHVKSSPHNQSLLSSTQESGTIASLSL